MNDIIWDGEKFITAGDNGAMKFSTDGINWKGIIAGNIANKHLESLTQNGDVYVAVGDDQNIFIASK